MSKTCPTCGSSVGEDELIAQGELRYCKNCKNDFLQRLREGADILIANPSGKMELITDLRRESTWRLVFLTILTLGIYAGHYVVGQTRVFNRRLEEVDRVTEGFVHTILVLNYLAVMLFLPYLVWEGEAVEALDKLSTSAERIGNILMLVWGFKARNRMNRLLTSEKADPSWFHGFWTFVLTPFYFNYKVNTLAADQFKHVPEEEQSVQVVEPGS